MPLDPASQATLQNVANDVNADVTDVKLAVAAYKKGGWPAVAAILGTIVPDAERSFADVRAALPAIKAGYQTTEFWLTTAGLIIPVLALQILGKPLPFDVVGVLGGVIGVYAAIRGLLKSNTATAAAAASGGTAGTQMAATAGTPAK